MERQIAELIEDFCDAEIYEGYSGRGMYGRETTGVTVNSLSEVAASMIANAEEVAVRVAELKAAGVEMPTGFRQDSMGYDTIIY